MKWPMSHEFNEAVQNSHLVFTDVDLRTGETELGARGLPLPRSGNFADVYKIHGADGRDWAVKCFTRPVTGLRDRYAAISKALAHANLPFTADFTYLPEGILINGARWPVLKMEWIEGLLLNRVARENAGRPAKLTALGQMWVKLCRRLRESGVAHADLQHGNVLMIPGSHKGAYGLKLIDYDGMFVPALANQPSEESGHPAYQHPRRNGPDGYSLDVDRFPQLLIATALKSLEVCGQRLWEKYDTGDNLLFLEADIKKPSTSKLMRELWQTGHQEVQSLVGRLVTASQRPISQTPWLDEIAPEGEPLPLDEGTRQEAIQVLALSRPIPVPLPPEHVSEPVSWDDGPGQLLEENSAGARTESTRRSSQRRKLASSSRKGYTVQGTEESFPRKKPKREQEETEKPNILPALLLAFGCLVLLCSGVVVGIVLSVKNKNKQEQEIAVNNPEGVDASVTKQSQFQSQVKDIGPSSKRETTKKENKESVTPPPEPDPPPTKETPTKKKESFPRFPAVPPVDIPPTELDRPSLEIPLSTPATTVCVGGGGRYLLLLLPLERRIVVFDVSLAKIVKSIAVDSQMVLCAAGFDSFVLVYPETLTIEKWSLDTFTKETTGVLPTTPKLIPNVLAMGSASHGPLLVQANDHPRLGERFLYDITTMSLIPGTRTTNGKVGAIPGNQLRAAPDGSVFTIMNTSFGSASFLVATDDGYIESDCPWRSTLQSPLPSGDGFTILGPGEIVSRRGERLVDPIKAPINAWFLPATHGPLFLGIVDRIGIGICPSRQSTTLFMIPKGRFNAIERLAEGTATTGRYEGNVFFIPDAKIVAVLPKLRNRITLCRLDIDEELTKVKTDYLFVNSSPAAVVPGKTFEYAIEVKSKKGGVKFTPNFLAPGMEMSEEGKLKWDVPSTWDSNCTVSMVISDASGREINYSFDLIPSRLP